MLKNKSIQSIFLLLVTLIIIFACSANFPVNSSTNNTKYTSTPKINYSVQKHFLSQVNALRTKARSCGGKYFPATTPLQLNEALNLAAYHHSLDMSSHQFLDHQSSNGDNLTERLDRVKYAWRAVGENIAHNQRNVEQVLKDWLSSPGHCSNLMSPDFEQTGIAQVNWYWTQVYATPK